MIQEVACLHTRIKEMTWGQYGSYNASLSVSCFVAFLVRSAWTLGI